MFTQKMISKNQQVDSKWSLRWLDEFSLSHHNRHARRRIKSADSDGVQGGTKRNKRKCKSAKLARRKNRKAKQ